MTHRRGFRSIWLLASLVALFLVQPFLPKISALLSPLLSEARGIGVVTALLYSLILLAAIRATSERRAHVRIAIAFAVPAFVTGWLVAVLSEAGAGLRIAELSLYILFLGYSIGRLLKYVASSPKVSGDQLAGAISIYFILGHLWSMVYMVVELAAPGSFEGLTSGPGFASGLNYYSFVTLTTLGYGDVLPVTDLTRTLAALEAMTGVLYIATLVARLVSVYRGPSDSE